MTNRILSLLLGVLCLAIVAGAQTPQTLRPVTRADILRGEYGRYRANNDLLYYHLDIRVDPEKKFISGKNTIRFKMLKDDTRIQLDLYANSERRQDSAAAPTPLKYERELNAVFVDFPETLKPAATYTIDFYYSGTPLETGRFGGFTFQEGSGRPAVDQHCLRRRRRAASGGRTRTSGATKSRDGNQRRDSQRSGGCLERQVRRQDGSRRRLHALGLAGPLSHQQLQRLAQHRQVPHFHDRFGDLPLDFYALPENLEKAKKQFAQARE